jgi:hypothetical protein
MWDSYHCERNSYHLGFPFINEWNNPLLWYGIRLDSDFPVGAVVSFRNSRETKIQSDPDATECHLAEHPKEIRPGWKCWPWTSIRSSKDELKSPETTSTESESDTTMNADYVSRANWSPVNWIGDRQTSQKSPTDNRDIPREIQGTLSKYARNLLECWILYQDM